jgi:peptidoglycan hydrolase CwlO-like protein
VANYQDAIKEIHQLNEDINNAVKKRETKKKQLMKAKKELKEVQESYDQMMINCGK